MKQFVSLLLLLLSSGLGLLARAAPGPPVGPAGLLVLRDTARVYPLGRHWSLLADRRPDAYAHPLTLAQVQAPPYAARFRPSTEDVPNRNADPADYWLHCQVRNDGRAATAWILNVGVSNVRTFEVLLVRDDGQLFRQVVEDGAYLARTHAVPSRVVNVALPLRPGRNYALYVHGWADLFSFNITERSHFLQVNREWDVRSAVYFGILLALAAYNLLLFFSVRDRGYGYYVLFTLSFGLVQAHMMGYLQQLWLTGLDGAQQTVVQEVLLGINLAAGIQMARAFLDTARLLPRVDRLLRAALLLTPLPVLACWLPVAAAAYVPLVVPLLVCILLIAAGLWQLGAGYRPARYFMAGWALLVGAIVVYYLRTMGVLPVSFLTEHGVRMASALEVILLSIGLADRINLARQERQAAQRQALAAWQEKDEVQQRANETLSQRARELQQAYSELQESLRTTGRLQELDELKTRFFTNISHELRTPLTLILGPLDELLTGTPPAPAALAAQHALMHRHAARLLELINQLLDIARLEAGQLRLHARPTDLPAFVRSSVAAFDSLAAARGLQLRAVVPAALRADVDPDQLEKVLTNLLGNALKFTPAGGKVQVDLRAESAHAVLTVADTGPGIPAAHLPLIFDRFHQVDDSPGRRHPGSGIGLALVKELVNLHHGTVTVQSTEGMGTTFVVRLPIINEELRMKNEELSPILNKELPASSRPMVETEREELLAENQAAMNQNSSFLIPNSSLSEASSAASPLVLVVDDHADMRAYVAQCLGAEFRVLTAAEGEAGLAQITDTLPDLVVSDLMMPGLDGLELCRRLKTDERTSHIPVVLLTARTADDSRLAGLELGADDYLTKPFRPQELRARVRNLLRQRELLRRRFAREVTLQPRDIAITSADEAFLTRALAVVERELANADFDVEQFAAALHLSRIQLYRKLKALTDQAPTDFVRTLRLRRAAQLLAAQAGNVADVAYQVGFTNLSYFSKCFREQFGHVPSEHAASAA
ncbi:7TM diverse intracellular signaling domain-containing protein [Hymenobacter sp.]|uniref:7TM diverse intracellular signaling domain-containing protein n=1 Tax=Hymenobacter sp. TaxID=1898978 RepID=UPI00286BADC3|nr:7TM diverse intracellular signaling domain-containing protein [Hymenobacter sp.]